MRGKEGCAALSKQEVYCRRRQDAGKAAAFSSRSSSPLRLKRRRGLGPYHCCRGRVKEKTYSEMTLDIYEPFDKAQGKFMARMLFYLPDKHRKAIRYYGIYAHGIKNKLDQITRKTWAKAIESSFDANPEICPDCGAEMIESAVFSHEADRQWKKLWKTHLLYDGYFRMKKGP